MFGMLLGGITLVGTALQLYDGQKRRADNERQREHERLENERQREHERDMAQRAETNPNIFVQTGRVRHDLHFHGVEFAGVDSNAVSRIASTGISAINSTSN